MLRHCWKRHGRTAATALLRTRSASIKATAVAAAAAAQHTIHDGR
jgi:hypothetical protein